MESTLTTGTARRTSGSASMPSSPVAYFRYSCSAMVASPPTFWAKRYFSGFCDALRPAPFEPLRLEPGELELLLRELVLLLRELALLLRELVPLLRELVPLLRELEVFCAITGHLPAARRLAVRRPAARLPERACSWPAVRPGPHPRRPDRRPRRPGRAPDSRPGRHPAPPGRRPGPRRQPP